MQRWEYGFFDVKQIITKEKMWSAEGYYQATFNGEIIEKCDIDKGAEHCRLLAFNKLGSMGWELCTYSIAYYSKSEVSESVTMLNQRIVFKRPIGQS